MKFDKKNLIIQLLAVFGLIVSIKLAFIYFSANYDKYALGSFCSVNDFIDCDGVAKTTYSQVFGIPLAYWGIFFYFVILFLTIVNFLKNIKCFKFLEVFKEPKAYIATLGTVSFILSMGLACTSLFVIKKICILCFLTYFIDLIIALVASDGLFKHIVSSFKITFFDFIAGAKQYTKTFIVLLLLAVSFLAYSGLTLNFVPHIKKHHSIMKYRKIKHNPYRIKGNVLGNENGDVVIELYSDYVCPLCYIQNIMLHQAVKEFSNIKINHHNLPFDKECNPYIQINMHPYACFMSKAAIAARNQGNYWEMSSLLYEKQPKKIDDLIPLVEEAGLDKTKFLEDFGNQSAEKEIEAEVSQANDLELDSTPTMFIDGEKIVGVKPYYMLKELLIKHGAKK